ncbi:MAG: tetratricopeptide repeat protein [Candidatus Hydrogenedentes bacterium]|nr:tetratricopeptide repeat protein [Candidatus Hydrogenedentota bacterium]
MEYANLMDNPAGEREGGASPRVLGVCLVALAVLVYGQMLGHDFVSFDDPAYVVGNPHVNGGLTWAGVQWAFTGVHVGNWHPLTSLAHMLDVSLFGLRPWGHHLMSLVLHAINGVLAFGVLRGLTGATWPSFLVAALFTVHPLHVESVAWVSIKKDLLSTAFWWLAIWAYGRYVTSGGWRAYAGVLALLALGLMSKPMVVTLPVVLLVLDFWPLNRYADKPFAGTALRLAVEKLPLLGLSLAAGLLTLWAQRADGAVRSLSVIPIGARIENALHSCVLYLVQTVQPVGLSPYYPHPGESLPLGVVLGCGVLLVSITVMAAVFARRAPWLLAGWAWYGITLLPVIGLITVGDQARADRYTYLPLVGIFIALAWTLDRELQGLPRETLLRRGIAWGLIVPLSLLAFVQASQWRDDATLFGHAMATAPDNAMAAVILAQNEVKAGRFQEAIALLEAAEKSYPRTRNLYNTLGLAHAGLGDFPRAIACYEKELAYAPDHASALSNCGNAYAGMGDTGTAGAYYQRAIEADPFYADGYANLGVLKVMAGDAAGAEPLLARAAALAPGDVVNWVNLGAVQEALGKREAAVASCRRAMAIDPAQEKVVALRGALGL